MLSFQRWWKHAKVQLTISLAFLLLFILPYELMQWVPQDDLVLSEGLTRWGGHILLHLSCRIAHDGIPRVHVVEEIVFGPRFPVVGSTLLSPKIRRRMRYCLCSRMKRKESYPPERPHHRGRLLLIYYRKKKRRGNGELATSFEADFQAGSGFDR